MTGLPATLREGERIDRYRVICEIATGGMATVFLAHRPGLGGFNRLVAIKRLHPHLSQEKQFVDMFLDEARLVAEIHHPNVVPTLDILQTDQGLCLVMEYVEGVPLHRLLRRSMEAEKPISNAVALRIMLDALNGLHGAHELRDPNGELRGLVHRDVSPQNILVGSRGQSVILDFGVAHATERLTNTTVGQMKGKLAYMAPEQASGGDVDRRTDVFAAGIVLWETLASRRLFYGSNEVDTLSRVLKDPIPTLKEAVPNIDPRLESVVMKALEREVAKRYQSCAEFADDLERVAGELGTLGQHDEVGAAVEELGHAELEERRTVVRDALARAHTDEAFETSSGVLSADSTGSIGAVATGAGLQEPTEPTQVRQSGGTMIGVGVGALAVLGVVAFFATRSCSNEPTNVAAATASSNVAAAAPVASASVVEAAAPPSASSEPAVAESTDAGAEEDEDEGEDEDEAKAKAKPNPNPGRRWLGFKPKPKPEPEPEPEPEEAPEPAPAPKPDPKLVNPYR